MSKNKKRSDEVVAEEVVAEEVVAEEVVAEEVVYGYFVSSGVALTSKRGILSGGAEIKPEDLAGGKDALDVFIKTGHVVKK